MKAIITFHSIDDRGTVLSFPPSKFSEMVTDLLDSEIAICTLDKLLSPDTDNAVAITFDDGMHSVYEHALPVLKDAKVPSHLYLTTGYIGGENNWPTQPAGASAFDMMGWHEIEACVEAGMHIENHTVSHPNLCKLSQAKIEDECEVADHYITKYLGRRPKHFAYPYGAYDARVSEVVGKKYESCVTTELLPLGRKLVTAELPRLDSYYLQNWRSYNRIFSPSANGYLRLRHYLRVFRSML
jgi:peptidoglycan/xylan/chitin deacetylase (PgdA/CDA1 family)